MNWEFIINNIPLYEKAALLTVSLGAAGIFFAVLIGLVCAFVEWLRIPVLCRIAGIYTEISRNTPLLIQLFFLYYGFPKIGIQVSPEAAGMIGLSFLGGSYMAEAFRSGIESVPLIQTESAESLGMSRAQVMFHVILPQALAISFPGFTANVIFLLKETSVFSAVSLMDLMFTAKDLIGMYAKTVESLFLLVIFYLMILLPVSLIGRIVERRLSCAGTGI